MNMFSLEKFFYENYLQTMWNSVRYKCDKNNKHWGKSQVSEQKNNQVQQEIDLLVEKG